MKTVAFIPIKLNNQRLPGKNTMLLGNKPMMCYIQETAVKSQSFNEIYVFCSSEYSELKPFLIDGVRYLQRDNSLDLPTANRDSLLKAFASKVKSDIYAAVFATSPFLSAETIANSVNAVKNGEHNFAVSVKKMQNFFWKENKPLNYSFVKIPRTQDLEKVYVESGGIYVYAKSLVENLNTVGFTITPYMAEISDTEAIDIDYPEDFDIANAVYKSIINKE